MPLYHVNYHATTGSYLDEEGLDLPSLGEALQFVFDLVAELRAEDPVQANWAGCRFEVVEHGGSIMLTLPVPRVMTVIARRERH
jgi:hypothetical protein